MSDINRQINEIFEGQQYCDFRGGANNVVSGKDVLVCFFSHDGLRLLAIAGQQNMSLSKTKDTSEVNSKDSGGWKRMVGGLKQWGIDIDGVFVQNDESRKELIKAFDEDILLCMKVVNIKSKTPMYGGLGLLSEDSFEAPYDDAATYTLKVDGVGKLVDLSESTTTPAMPGEKVNTTEAILLSVVFGGIDLTPEFSPSTKNYTATTTATKSVVQFTAPSDTTVIATHDSTTFVSGEELTLKTGVNTIEFNTTAPAITSGGANRTSKYTVKITK